jgi:hypothetical protein
MPRQSSFPVVLRPSILLGIAVLLALAVASFAPRVHIGIIEVLFLLGLGLSCRSAQIWCVVRESPRATLSGIPYCSWPLR